MEPPSEKIKIFKKYYIKNNVNYIAENNWDKMLEKIKYRDNAASISGGLFLCGMH